MATTERRRHARTPVNLNALLIGEKTVPKGCRVINVSQQGMLLYCEADGRLSTFNDGDTVDIHLTVQHEGEQKKLTIPAIVRHVAENSVDVEFLHPDPVLTSTIESYRVSDRHRLEASLGQNHGTVVTPLLSPRMDEPAAREHDNETARPTHRPVYIGMLTLLLGICIVTGGYIYTASIDSRISTLETLGDHQAGELEDIKNRVFSTSLQQGRYDSLNARIAALADAFTRLENRLLDGVPVQQDLPATGTDGAPEPGGRPAGTGAATAGSNEQEAATTHTAVSADHRQAAAIKPAPGGPFSPAEQDSALNAAVSEALPSPNRTASAGTDQAAPVNPERRVAAMPTDAPGEPAQTPADVDAEPMQPASPARPVAATAETMTTPVHAGPVIVSDAGTPAPETAQPAGPAPRTGRQAGSGPWCINLLSSPERADVARLADKAARLGISTHIVQAEVKGRVWWRLQVTGFGSMAEASAAAEPLKQSLGIKSVWFLKQK